jgi:hypothetical protein
MTSLRDLTTDLRALPLPAPPPDLTAVVLARIAQLEDRKTDAVIPAAAARRPDWSMWISLGGLVAGLLIAVLNSPSASPILSFGRGGAMGGLADVSSAPLATVSLLAGFAIYLASLFLPVRERR